MIPTPARRVIVTGATGLIGRGLCAALQQRGYAVVVFSRDPNAARLKVPGASEYVEWHPDHAGPWIECVDGAHGVVHLAGGTIFAPGQRQTREAIRAETENRARAIRGLVDAIEVGNAKPRVFVAASSVGTFGYAGYSDDEITESSPPGTDFWGQDSVCWEAAALAAQRLGVCVVVVRTGYVLDSRGGGLPQQVEQFRRGFGGPVLPGTQWVPWIHLADAVGLFLLALEDDRVRGPLNATAPDVVRNRAFADAIGEALGKPARLPIPGFVLRLFLGVTSDIIVHGRRVVPKKALDLGYQFQYPTLKSALADLIERRRDPIVGMNT
jgi:uncharacterized protein (TIGR01777 family)